MQCNPKIIRYYVPIEENQMFKFVLLAQQIRIFKYKINVTYFRMEYVYIHVYNEQVHW